MSLYQDMIINRNKRKPITTEKRKYIDEDDDLVINESIIDNSFVYDPLSNMCEIMKTKYITPKNIG